MKKIAVLMGGYSNEAEVSYKSGSVVMESLDRNLYEPYAVHITPEGWFCIIDNQHISIDKNDFSVSYKGEKILFDCAFNAIHGTPGEDGYLQAYFSFVKTPITGCSMYASALTFNKRDLLAVLKPYGIPMATSFCLNKGDVFSSREIVEKVGLPCFVKANKSGSSLGVYKVYEETLLEKAINDAFNIDNEVLIESFLQGMEVSVGVITYQKEILVLPITEIVSKNDFFDYQAKYEGKSEEITPARISEEMSEKVSTLAKKIYTILQMKGFSRSEFIIVNGVPHLLEMNTTPGLSKASILPQQAQKAGISLSDLFKNAIEEAING